MVLSVKHVKKMEQDQINSHFLQIVNTSVSFDRAENCLRFGKLESVHNHPVSAEAFKSYTVDSTYNDLRVQRSKKKVPFSYHSI